MTNSPGYKFFDAAGKYQGCTHDHTIAAQAVAYYGNGATIRWHGHSKKNTIFTQGIDGDAAENYDLVLDCHRAYRDKFLAAHKEIYG